MIMLLLAVLGAMAVIMTVGWFVQRGANNGGWTDVFWTYGTGATCALASLVPLAGHGAPTWRQIMVAALVAFWALRLGTYVAIRVAKGAEDVRYASLRLEWGAVFQRNMFGLLIVQAPTTAVLAISILFAARNPSPDFRPADAVGLLILLIAIVGEGVADEQMKRFKADPTNHGKVCDSGLWAWSRHPNYLFEFVGWIAYPVIAINLSTPWTLASLIGPVGMFVVVRYATGVPPLESAMIRSKGDAYRRYQDRVSPFLPFPPKARPLSEPSS